MEDTPHIGIVIYWVWELLLFVLNIRILWVVMKSLHPLLTALTKPAVKLGSGVDISPLMRGKSRAGYATVLALEIIRFTTGARENSNCNPPLLWIIGSGIACSVENNDVWRGMINFL